MRNGKQPDRLSFLEHGNRMKGREMEERKEEKWKREGKRNGKVSSHLSHLFMIDTSHVVHSF